MTKPLMIGITFHGRTAERPVLHAMDHGCSRALCGCIVTSTGHAWPPDDELAHLACEKCLRGEWLAVPS